ncbi:hypothetical protein [Ottowia sp.]|uniref:hypothetical protein n=1 Tax=Ottowia sp. TaxID=1898956 RepID=UPI002BAF07E3|nr:hypothetical protein [Ottowia sp.]HOB66208.1 hypothetical protein [Ottowia sp.]HPZ56704.1 hypothetical protein [Ottowia sp.]HQD47257.1 hypothetical protein [Ottowia sp.]
MQRTIQRLKAFHATIMPNSNSEASTLRGDTKCDDETMPDRFSFEPLALLLTPTRVTPNQYQFDDNLLTLYRIDS